MTVTLTLAPAAGYEPDAVTAYRTGASGTPVSLSGSGATRTFTMPAYGVTVGATFKKTQAQLDREAVDAAQSAIQNGTYRVAQATANDAASIRAWLLNTLNVLFGASHSVQFRSAETPLAGDVTVTAVTSATAGSESAPDGVDGSFAFSVSLARGAATATATFAGGVIIATPHASTPVKRIEALYLGNLNIRILNTGNVATGNLTLALSGANADAFTIIASAIETQGIASLPAGGEMDVALAPRAGLAVGTYTATLTVSGEGLTETVAVTVTHVVTPTGIEPVVETQGIASLQVIQAISVDGGLQVRGLTPGETFAVYNMSGRLIYNAKATAPEQLVPLDVRGIYVVVSGNRRVKTAY